MYLHNTIIFIVRFFVKIFVFGLMKMVNVWHFAILSIIHSIIHANCKMFRYQWIIKNKKQEKFIVCLEQKKKQHNNNN
jgi:hypothetical protein